MIMKSVVSFTIFFIAAVLCASAQKATNTPECNFLGPLHFINGKAIVVVKATYNDLHLGPPEYVFDKIKKKISLFNKDYYSKHGVASAIAFTPENCLYEYSGIINKKVNLNRIKFGQTVYLTCTVFKAGESYKNVPFFVIDKVAYDESDTTVKADIRPLAYINSKYIDTVRGSAFFSNDADLLARKLKCLLVITPSHFAFIQTKDDKLISFKYEKRVINNKGYIDFYKNDTTSFELNIDRIITRRSTSTYRNGRLTVIINNIKTSFDVYGYDEELDQYNKPDY
jgi:hypothetical protein